MTDHDPDDTVVCLVSNEALRGAIEILRAQGGFDQHSEAYQTLVFERSRRELQSPPQEIKLRRAAFQALPGVVQRLLMTGKASRAADC